MGVGEIEIVFDPADLSAVKYCDSLGSTIDPAVKLFVPSLDLQNRRSIRLLDKDKKLLVKGQAVIAAGRTKKVPPSLRAGHLFLCVLV